MYSAIVNQIATISLQPRFTRALSLYITNVHAIPLLLPVAMTKRRRERDRPKAGPDSAYDPNKRVHLSYDDEPTASSEPSTGVPEASNVQNLSMGADAATSKAAAIAEHHHEDGPANGGADSAQGAAQYGTATNLEDTQVPQANVQDAIPAANEDNDEYDPEEAFNLDAASEEASEPTPKKTSPQRSNARPGKNQATNMKPALGSLSYQWEDAEEEGWASEEDEAMAYLRSVREERQALPGVFVSTRQNEEEDIYATGDGRGYMVEDCYIARPTAGPPRPAKTLITPREAYTTALTNKFLVTRAGLLKPPPAEADAGQTMKPTPLAPSPYGNAKIRHNSTRVMREFPPTQVQLHEIDYDAALALLDMIREHLLERGKPINRNTSAWLWALLAKLDDVGAMNNDEVSVLRELGKRAVIVQISFKDSTAAAELEDLGRKETTGREDDGDEAQRGEEDGSQAEADKKADTAETSASDKASEVENTLATLDMILTVVGETFRQRDLLEFRRPWENEE